ncbi:MAG TPA: alkaline phosphatase [Phycisphaerae bacterium]|nr:alkaline phosphatase [Phycisphaerae bacterium]
MRKFAAIVGAGFLLVLSAAPVGLAAAPPKNVIFFIGDGMGPEQVLAANYYNGGDLSFEAFTYQGFLTTYSANSSVTDSAAAGTALATGIKVNNGVISMAYPGNGSELETLLEYARDRSKSTGLVSTTYLTHATPAAFGAHEPSRNNTSNIATDYLSQTQPNILFGGGANGMSGAAATAAGYTVVTDAAGMLALNTNTETMVSGQFGSTHLPYEYDGLGSLPHLSDMTVTALDTLDNDADGFFLMVEGGRIDHAGHSNDLPRNVLETIEFANAVQEAIDWAVGRTDTLILVTADHETGGLTDVTDNGEGSYPDGTWSTTDHTATNVPVYAWGVNSDLISGTMDNTDMWNVVTLPEPATMALLGFGVLALAIPKRR